jgi:hypothetical protein
MISVLVIHLVESLRKVEICKVVTTRVIYIQKWKYTKVYETFFRRMLKAANIFLENQPDLSGIPQAFWC